MGVPKFFRFITRKYPNVIIKINPLQIGDNQMSVQKISGKLCPNNAEHPIMIKNDKLNNGDTKNDNKTELKFHDF